MNEEHSSSLAASHRVLSCIDADDPWLHLRDYVSTLTGRFDDLTAKRITADRLRDGLLLARAAALRDQPAFVKPEWSFPSMESEPQVSGSGRDAVVVVLTGRRRPKPIKRKPIELPTSFWSESVDWQGDVAAWQWGPGNLVVTTSAGGKRKLTMLWNVQVRVPRPASPAKLNQQSPAISRGRPRSAGWCAWIAALAKLAITEGLDRDATAAGLAKRLKLLSSNGGVPDLPPRSARTACEAVLRRLHGKVRPSAAKTRKSSHFEEWVGAIAYVLDKSASPCALSAEDLNARANQLLEDDGDKPFLLSDVKIELDSVIEQLRSVRNSEKLER